MVYSCLQGHMVTVSLKGYIFFGSALRISSEVQQIAEVNCSAFPYALPYLLAS